MRFWRLFPLVAVALVAATFVIPGCDELITETNNVTQVDTTLGLECSRCHTDGNNRYLRPERQWANSAHASDELLRGPLDFNGVQREVGVCGPECHTHEGYLHWLENGTRKTQQTPNAIGCFTCHSPHTGDFGTWSDTILRASNADGENYVDLIDGIYDIGRSNLCAQCHQARATHPTTVENQVTIDEDFGPHFSCQADVIMGKGGWLFGEAAPTNTHQSNKNGCLSCHFGVGQAYQFGEHTFELEDEKTGTQYLGNCGTSGCHTGNRVITDLYDFAEFNSIPILADSLEFLLRTWGYLNSDDPTGTQFTTDIVVSSRVANVINNFLLYKMDGSNGVHNPAYFEKLLSVSVAQWEQVPPAVDFAVSDTVVCAGDTVFFYDNSVSQTAVVLWSWDFGDGTTSSESNPWHIYEESGEFDVALEVTDNHGSAAKTKSGLVSANGVTAAFDTDTTEGFADLTVTFTDASTCVTGENARWFWDFGDGTTVDFSADSAGDPVAHTYTAVGTYSPTLTVATDIDTSTFSTTVEALGPVAAFEASRKFGFPDSNGLEIQFFDRSESPDDLLYHWDFGVPDSAGDTSNLQNPIWVYTTPGEYDVTLAVASVNPDHGGDTATAAKYVKVFAPIALFAVDVDTGCAPLDVQFTDNSLGVYNIDSVIWYFGDTGADSTLTVVSRDSLTVSHTYATEGLFTCSLTVFSDYGNNTRVETGLVAARGPSGTITASIDTVCAGEESIAFTFDPTCPIDSYSWDFGDGNTSSEQNPSHSWSQSGSFEVELTVENSTGSNTVPYEITVLQPSTQLSLAGSNEGCAPFNIQLTTEDQCNISTYIFDYGDGSKDTLADFDIVNHTYADLGEYEVSIEVFGTGGSYSDTLDELITVTGPQADFDVSLDTACVNSDVVFTETSGCNVTGWGWNFGDGSTSNESSPTHQYTAPGTYYISLTVTDDDGNSDSRTESDSVVVVDELPDPTFTWHEFGYNNILVIEYGSLNWSTAYWDWGDGNTQEVGHPANGGVEFTHRYDEPGTYEVTLTVENACGLSAPVTQTVEVTVK